MNLDDWLLQDEESAAALDAWSFLIGSAARGGRFPAWTYFRSSTSWIDEMHQIIKTFPHLLKLDLLNLLFLMIGVW